MRCPAARSLEHLAPFQREKFFVLLRTPGERVNAIETQNMVDPKKVKASPDAADPLPPPIEIPVTHHVPVKNRDSPILSPFLGEPVVLKMGFRRCASTPIMRKFIRPCENVRAVVADAEWNIAHQRNAALIGIRLDGRPLLVRDPLNVTEKIFAILEALFLFRRLLVKPGPRRLDVLMLSRPFVPRFALAVLFHERAKECVIIKPSGLLISEISKLRLSILRRMRRKVCERFLEQTAFQFFDSAVFDRAVTKFRKIDIDEGGLVILAR